MARQIDPACPDAAPDVQVFHLLQIKYALLLETKGIKVARRSVYAYTKKTYGLTGSRSAVLAAFCERFDLGSPDKIRGRS